MRFLTRSLLIIFALYALVFAVGNAYLAHQGAPIWVALLFTVGLIGLQFLLSPWIIELLMDIHWEEQGAELSAQNREFLEQLCAENGLSLPRIGIIHSGTPNAFCFGRFQRDARLVVTDGLLEVLTPEEANAVIAHEVGHIKHWDFAVMTLAALAPLILYQLYIYTEKISNTKAIAYSAYVCYWISEFIVLLLNRTREYYADNFSANATKAPEALASALVKIAYGMVRADGEYQEAMQKDSGKDKSHYRREHRLAGAMGLMGISNLRAGAALALAQANPAEAAAVMRWDLVNPWARFYQLNSTHPLTALRVRELNREAESLHKAVQYPLPQDQHIQWGTFPLQLLLWGAPFVTGFALVACWWYPEWLKYFKIEVLPTIPPVLLVLTGIAWLARIAFRYSGEFKPASVGSLLEDVEVSQMQPVAVRLSGKILGRGEPGAFWSPDLVLRDSSGIIFLLYRQSIPFARFLFAISEAANYIDQEVVVEGWFRRGMTPYVEMSRLICGENVHRAYSRWIQYAGAVIAITIGCMWYLSL